MKPFNLDRALSGDPVVDGLGRKVIDLYHFAGADEDCCVVVLFEDGSLPTICSRTGVRYARKDFAYMNLFMQEKKCTRWIACFADAEGVAWAEERESASEAMASEKGLHASVRLVGVYPLEVEA